MGAQAENLVVLLCDQLQRDVLDVYGGRVPTRAWSTLAGQGAVCERFYCATPLCMPTRPSMMTGRWAHSHGALCFGEGYDTVRAGVPFLPDLLQDAGFAVGYEGIWHCKREAADDRRDAYEHFRETGFPYGPYAEACECQGHDPGLSRAAVNTPTDDGRTDWSFSIPVPRRWDSPLDEHPDMQTARHMADFIRAHAGTQPFAAWASIGAPHPPLLVPEPFYSMFDPDSFEAPPGFGEQASPLPRNVREDAPGYQAVLGWSHEQWAIAAAGYHGYAAFADHCLEVVLAALRETGQMERTLVVATADHGEMLGAHNLYQKGVLYDRACRLPAVFCGPGVTVGRYPQLMSHVDLMPTVLEAFGLTRPEGVQGTSQVDVLRSPGAAGPAYQFVEFNGYIRGGIRTRAAISEEWKYIWAEGDLEMLFHLPVDPDERQNLAMDPGVAGILAAHRAALRDWCERTGDICAP
ncbi:MAG: sulfatase-like hydrolase/transferase [Victivallales bacterium]|nr:sulfatase-like hydrolase/transferase [Victivallales bacterium]MBT7161499.1 sulfatase-like hydrolase/transferase [Victivallales bacterium]